MTIQAAPEPRWPAVGRKMLGGVAVLLGLWAALPLATPPQAAAHSYKLGAIAIGHIWAPPPEDGAEGVPVYGPIFNQGGAAVKLVGASTPAAGQARLREAADGKVTWPDAVVLPAGRPVALAAWRQHIWLSDLRQPLREGDTFPLTLDFGQAGTLDIEVVVETASGH